MSSNLDKVFRPVLETVERRFAAQADRMWRFEETPPPYLWPLLLGSRREDATMPKGDAAKPVVKVRVNHGIWQTQCPFCDSAQHASETDRRFYCANCENVEKGNRTLPVEWPDLPLAIDMQLAKRPRREFRSWEPGETIKDLKQQDEEAIATLG